jgi:membrane protein DedA with SNARE-associated domain
VTTPPLVFLVTWVANLLGAAGVYLAARRYGRRLFASPTGRRLLAPRSLAIIEREYLRFGTVGIFLSRFLPGIRAVVPPFAGLIGLSAGRTFVPIGIASALWYGGITILGALVGSEWGRITALLLGINRTLAVAALVLAAAGAIWYAVRARGRRRERVWHATEDALEPAAPSFLAGTEVAEGSARQAAALAVLELA